MKTLFSILFVFAIQAFSFGKNFHPNAVNPIANDDYFTTNEDVQLVANLSTNDIQSNNGNNVWSIVSNPSHGIVQIISSVFIRYTPVANYNGKDTFYYKICANNGQCDTAMVVITINAVNDLPLARNDAFSMNEDNILNGNVSANDTQSGDGGNNWSVLSNPINGSVLLNSNGTFLYVSNPDYNGKDSFYYRLCDIDGDCSTGKVVITIRPVNDLPVVVRDTFSTDENTALSSNVATNDTLSGDGGNSFSLVSNPTHGFVLFSNNGNFTYSPGPNYTGLDSFSYRLCDANGDCRSTFAVITVNAVNHYPVAIDNNFYGFKNTTLNAEVASNDTQSPDGGNTWSLIQGTTSGTLVFNTDGTFDYTPNQDFIGEDTFYYSLCDANNDCAYAMVIITVSKIVPIRLSTFNASQINQHAALLQWKVEQEINVSRYEIEKSTNGLNFVTSGSVNSKFSSTAVNEYSFVDQFTELKSTVYYRLKTIDNDGKYYYSRVIALNINKSNSSSKLEVYPNPFSSTFSLNLESNINTEGVLNISTLSGHRVIQKTVKIKSGIALVDGLNMLPKGMYIIELNVGNDKMMTRVIKL